MAILDLQRRYRELGRIRIGDTVPGDEGKRARPVRLRTFRLTSPSRELLEQAEALWGGSVGVWEGAPTEGEQYELVTDAETLEVLVPPQDLAGSQYLELWSKGGASRRCDGRTELISGKPCLCDPERRDCSPVSHLVLMLPELADIGTWRVVTRSWNAGAELPGTVELLTKLAAKGAIPRAVLAIEQRTVKRDGRTQHFSLPVLQVPWSLAQAEREGVPILTGGRPQITPGVTELPTDASFAHDRAGWGAPAALPEADAGNGGPADAEGVGGGGAGEGALPPPAPRPAPPPTEAPITPVGTELPDGSDPQPVVVQPSLEAEPVVIDTEPVPEAQVVPQVVPLEVPDDDEGAWGRYQAAVDALPKPGLSGSLLKRSLRALHREGPPTPAWPAEVLDELAEVLKGAVGHPAGQGDG